MRLVLQIALGIVLAPIVALVLLGGLLSALANLEMILLLGAIAAGVLVVVKLGERGSSWNESRPYKDRGRLR